MERHSHDGGWWELARRDASPAVRDCVPGYVGYAESSVAPVCRLEVPHPNITVIINLGAPLAVHAPALGGAGPTFQSFAAGLFDTVAVTCNTGDSRGIELNLTPLGMWRLAGIPMHELTNRVVALDDIIGAGARDLEQRLRNAVCWDDCFTLLDAALAHRLARRSAAPGAVQWAWAQLALSPTPMAVTSIATELQWSRARLSQAFREHVGLTPKSLARVVRFDRAVRRVRSDRVTRWSTIALDCGYADQSHLVREFREFSGLTPTEFQRRQGSGIAGVPAA